MVLNVVFDFLRKRVSHFIVWIIFIGYEAIVAKVVYNADFRFISIGHYLITVALFYVFAIYAMPFSSRIHGIFVLLICIAIYLGLYILLHFGFDNLLIFFRISDLTNFQALDLRYAISQFFRAIYFMGFSTAYYYLNTFNKEKKKSELLEKQRLNDIIQQQRMEQELVNAENAFLKAQINPHFLFNTLDFIYHEVHGSSPIAGEAIIDLSNMMRYAIEAGENAGVEVLGKEIEQVESLIHLYQLRKRGKYCIEFQASDEVKELYLIPLVLLTLVENVFKHGELLDEGNPASILLWTENECLHISTHNGVAASSFMKKSGYGLANTANRLNFAYGNAASLKSEQVNGNFQTEVSVPVDLLRRPAPPVLSSIKTDIE
jgi:sensor histidine kinase YesM